MKSLQFIDSLLLSSESLQFGEVCNSHRNAHLCFLFYVSVKDCQVSETFSFSIRIHFIPRLMSLCSVHIGYSVKLELHVWRTECDDERQRTRLHRKEGSSTSIIMFIIWMRAILQHWSQIIRKNNDSWTSTERKNQKYSICSELMVSFAIMPVFLYIILKFLLTSIEIQNKLIKYSNKPL